MTISPRMTAAALAATAAVLTGGAAPAQAECYVDMDRPVPLGVCASLKPEPGRGTCLHVAVYTSHPTDPDPLVCTGI